MYTFQHSANPHSNFIRPQCAEWTKRGRGKPVLIMHIFFLSLELIMPQTAHAEQVLEVLTSSWRSFPCSPLCPGLTQGEVEIKYGGGSVSLVA